MAKKTPIKDLLAVLSGRYAVTQLDRLDRSRLKPSTMTVSETERTKLLEKAGRSQAVTTPSGISFDRYLLDMSKKAAETRVENDRIILMSPEVSQAADIMIPLIMAPNDLKSTHVQIVCNDPLLDEARRIRLNKLLTDHFEKELCLSTSIPKWIYEAMYRSGAKPLLVLPLTSFDQKLSEKNDIITGSLEAFHQFVDREIDQHSLYGFNQKTSRLSSRLVASTESLLISTFKDLDHKYEVKGDSHKRSSIHEKFVSSIISSEALVITDNPDTIRAHKARNDKKTAEIKKKTQTVYYRESPAVFFDRVDDDTVAIDKPIFMELPYESVIPIYTPGTPGDHLGYFILLDDYGHPVNVSDYAEKGVHGVGTNYVNQTNFTELFQAYGFKTGQLDNHQNQEAMASVYQQIIEAHLKERAENAGFADIRLGSNTSVYRYLFARYLQQRRSKILYVPREMLTYFCFETDAQGRGVSRLEKIKYILSLRITLMTCRMLTEFNAAIDRRLININFTSDFAGDVLQHMKIAQQQAVAKSAVTFSHDPLQISQQIADKSFSIKANGIPGLAEYTVTNEPNERASGGTISPDLNDDIKNMLILGLDIPPAVMNNLSDSEYSRSVATTNLFFSRRIVGWQKIVTKYINQLIRTYIRFSADLQQLILAELSDKTQSGQDDLKGELIKLNKKTLNGLLDSITIALPEPNIAPDNAEFEALDKLISSLDTLITAIMPDDMASGDADEGQFLTISRAITKSKILTKFTQDFGLNDIVFPELGTYTKDVLDLRQVLANGAEALRQHNEQIVEKSKSTSSSSDGFNTPTDPSLSPTDDFDSSESSNPEEGEQTPALDDDTKTSQPSEPPAEDDEGESGNIDLSMPKG